MKKFFWTISQRNIAYQLDWKITYFCAKFQRLTPNSFSPYIDPYVIATKINEFAFAKVKNFVSFRRKQRYIESSKFWKKFFFTTKTYLLIKLKWKPTLKCFYTIWRVLRLKYVMINFFQKFWYFAYRQI